MAKDSTDPVKPILEKPLTDVLKPAAGAPSSAPAEPQPKRRPRPAVSKKRVAKSPAKKSAKAEPEILFMVETEEGSETFEMQELHTVAELLDLLDEKRQIVATRSWRTFGGAS